MDKSWIQLHNRSSKAYVDGVEDFLRLAYNNKNMQTSHIKCPCTRCVNRVYYNLQSVKDHIEMYGLDKSYKNWIFHGEPFYDIDIQRDNLSDDIVVDEIPIEPNSEKNMIAMVQEGLGFRNEKKTFNGKVNNWPPPLKLTGSDVLRQLNELDIETEYKKEDVFRKREREQLEKEIAKATKGKAPKTRLNWKKKSIFFELPYWEHNLIRHNLDVMHIEKNVCDNVISTVLGIWSSVCVLQFLFAV